MAPRARVERALLAFQTSAITVPAHAAKLGGAARSRTWNSTAYAGDDGLDTVRLFCPEKLGGGPENRTPTSWLQAKCAPIITSPPWKFASPFTIVNGLANGRRDAADRSPTRNKGLIGPCFLALKLRPKLWLRVGELNALAEVMSLA